MTSSDTDQPTTKPYQVEATITIWAKDEEDAIEGFFDVVCAGNTHYQTSDDNVNFEVEALSEYNLSPPDAPVVSNEGAGVEDTSYEASLAFALCENVDILGCNAYFDSVAEPLGGECYGSGAGFGERDMQYQFDTWEQTKAFVDKVNTIQWPLSLFFRGASAMRYTSYEAAGLAAPADQP